MSAANRASIIRHALELQGMDGLLLNLPENILFGSGYWPSTSAALFIPTVGRSTLVIPNPDRGFVPPGWEGDVFAYDTRLEDDPSDLFIAKLIATAAGSKGTGKRRLGCDRCMETIAGTHIGGEARVPGEPFYKLLAGILPGAEFIDLTLWIYEARMVKTSEEVTSLRKCAEVVDKALDRARESLAPGMRETDLSAIIESAIQTIGVGYKGSRRARGYAFVMSGAENTAGAWAAYNISTDRKMAKGDLVLIELDSHVDGYWSDISRTFVVGKPSGRQKEIWKAVHDCQQRTVTSLRVGAGISGIDATARAFLTEKGYGAHFPHHIGHGVGFAFHEVPYLDPPSHIATDFPIKAGMVLAIEPGVYIEDWGGIRIEDNIVMTESGVAEFLSTADRSL